MSGTAKTASGTKTVLGSKTAPVTKTALGQCRTPSPSSPVPLPQSNAGTSDQIASVARLCKKHPFAPKSAFLRWLDAFADRADGGTSPPPMA